MAVHFWPAFWVMSRTTSPTKSPPVSLIMPVTSGPRMAALSESASTLTATERPTMFCSDRRTVAVSPEPVKASTSCSPMWLRRSPTPPQMRDKAPSGRAPVSTKRRIITHDTSDVAVAGFDTTGMPASNAAAAFSASPHAGKLKALMWTATPRRGV